MKSALLLAAAAIAAITSSPPPADQDAVLRDIWRNPAGTVAVRIGNCGPALCGWVAAASADAIADARDSGFPALVGMQLLTDYHHGEPHQWNGTVFVPDMKRSFSSHLVLVDHDHVRIYGCLVGKILCQSQLWQRG